MSSERLHEHVDDLSPTTRELHRAIVSLMEELEAFDWYQQRVDACRDADLRAILQHNRDEELEHAAMIVEWLRRRSTAFDGYLREYLFTSAPITEIETEAANGGEDREGGRAGKSAEAGSNPKLIGV